MSFSQHWLALRQHADSSARDASLAQAVAHWLARHCGSARSLLVDLGCGSGANCLHLAPVLPAAAQWLLVDHDAALLAAAQSRCAGLAVTQTRQADLATQLPTLPWSQIALVSASALLDLVSEAWVQQLVALSTAQHIPLLCVLSYDGRLQLQPADADDSWLRDAVNAHQRRDKGFGPALGPAASTVTAELLRDQQYWVGTHGSDWQLDASDAREAALMLPLIEGWASAAAEQQPTQAHRAQAWANRRTAAVLRGTLHILVGHQDLLALPPPR